MRFGGIFDYTEKKNKLEKIRVELESEAVWASPERAKALGQSRAQLEGVVEAIEGVTDQLADLPELLALSVSDHDAEAIQAMLEDITACEDKISTLEFQRMFTDPMDPNSCFLDVQAGSGGTEAQDWAQMLLRMYTRWTEHRGFKVKLIEQSMGDVAGIKSATLHIIGAHAYGWLRTETGVHRLVRKSPFDSGARRHTSFASVFVSPEIDDDIDVEINPADLRIDTYRSSGAGGQHVNTTDSAVRITHMPTNIVVQCQSDRSQHKNKAHALKQLKARLYQYQLAERMASQRVLEENKADISWGSQIRSYVLDASRIKDLRTGVEATDTQKVLDGGIDLFLEASLKEGVGSVPEEEHD